MESKRLALYVLAAAVATAVYYVLATGTDLSGAALLAVVAAIGVGIPQVYLYWREKSTRTGR